jgi:hypothetical protein
VNSFRPISVLPAISKLFEKVLLNRLQQLASIGNWIHPNQHGFQPQRKTESALHSLVSEIESGFEKNMATACAMIDIKSAFDTAWAPAILYILALIARKCPTFLVKIKKILDRLTACVSALLDWFLRNRVKTNVSKTELLFAWSSFRRSKPVLDPLHVGGVTVKPSLSVKILGVTLDRHLNLELHVSTVCKSAYHQIHLIGKIRKFLTLSAAKTLVISTILSGLDFCNGILAGLPDELITKLQRVQNAAARLVLQADRRADSSTLLRRLHWLAVASTTATYPLQNPQHGLPLRPRQRTPLFIITNRATQTTKTWPAIIPPQKKKFSLITHKALERFY